MKQTLRYKAFNGERKICRGVSRREPMRLNLLFSKRETSCIYREIRRAFKNRVKRLMESRILVLV